MALIAQLGEHCTGIAEVVGSNPAQSLNFFSGLCSSSATAALALITVNIIVVFQFKAGVHVKAVLPSLNTAFLPISTVTFQGTLNLSAYLINHCLAALCKFLGDFWAFWERDIFLNG